MHFRLKFQDKPLTQLNDNELINYIFIIMFLYLCGSFIFGNKRINNALNIFLSLFFCSIQFNSYVKSTKIKPTVKNKSGILNVLKTGLLRF